MGNIQNRETQKSTIKYTNNNRGCSISMAMSKPLRGQPSRILRNHCTHNSWWFLVITTTWKSHFQEHPLTNYKCIEVDARITDNDIFLHIQPYHWLNREMIRMIHCTRPALWPHSLSCSFNRPHRLPLFVSMSLL